MFSVDIYSCVMRHKLFMYNYISLYTIYDTCREVNIAVRIVPWCYSLVTALQPRYSPTASLQPYSLVTALQLRYSLVTASLQPYSLVTALQLRYSPTASLQPYSFVAALQPRYSTSLVTALQSRYSPTRYIRW